MQWSCFLLIQVNGGLEQWSQPLCITDFDESSAEHWIVLMIQIIKPTVLSLSACITSACILLNWMELVKIANHQKQQFPAFYSFWGHSSSMHAGACWCLPWHFNHQEPQFSALAHHVSYAFQLTELVVIRCVQVWNAVKVGPFLHVRIQALL
jgi:hypothetical protein